MKKTGIVFGLASLFLVAATPAKAQYVEAASKLYSYYSEGQSQDQLLSAISDVSQQIEAAKEEIIATINGVREQELAGLVRGQIDQLRTLPYMNSTAIWVYFQNGADKFAQIEEILLRGDANPLEMRIKLLKALNLLAPMQAVALKLVNADPKLAQDYILKTYNFNKQYLLLSINDINQPARIGLGQRNAVDDLLNSLSMGEISRFLAPRFVSSDFRSDLLRPELERIPGSYHGCRWNGLAAIIGRPETGYREYRVYRGIDVDTCQYRDFTSVIRHTNFADVDVAQKSAALEDLTRTIKDDLTFKELSTLNDITRARCTDCQ
jgi:hypothetical protein